MLQPHRYKGLYGGRGGAKSHFFGESVVIRAATEPVRIVCIREVQRSIKDSVKQLLSDKIRKYALPLEEYETEIRGENSLIVFKGMQSYNAENIKSLEGFDVAWVEEAQTLSQRSLDLLRPTIRKAGSELWFSWNPRYKTDPVDKFFRKDPPPDAVSVMVNWQDNPWFPDVLQREMEHDYQVDPDKAEHIWGGAYGAGEGAILARWVNRAEREARIRTGVNFDPEGAPVHVTSDIGFRDTAAWWYWQPTYGGFRLIDYDQDHGLDADDWAPRINDRLVRHGIKPSKLAKVWLPPDAKAKTFQSRHSAVERFLKVFGTEKVGIIPASKKADQISAAREVIDRCEFDRQRCEEGLDGLMAWEFDYNEDLGVFSREPVHNWASHPSDAFAYGCQVMKEQVAADAPLTEAERIHRLITQDVTLEDLWSDHVAEPKHQRI